MDNKQFILEILDKGLDYAKVVVPALVTYAIGLHQKQPSYMHRDAAADSDEKAETPTDKSK